jgi:actin-like ATPase involved in cell morphogenesis
VNVVFAIGCKRYRDSRVAQLKYADKDARRFVETVMATQDPDNTEEYLLHDEHENEDFRPTRANILNFLSLGEDRDKSIELDFLFFYFSGHGWSSQDGTDYLLTSDSLVRMLERTAIPVPMLERDLKSWGAKHVVLFIDACRTVMGGGKGSIAIAEESRINVDSLCPPGMVTYCSCEPGQTSYESDAIRSGVFTEGVCRALGDEGRCSTIEELDEYLNDKVPRLSRTYGLPPQRPYSRLEPLAVRNALIVSRRTLQGWQPQESEAPTPLRPQATGREESLDRYREVVNWVWTGEQLNEWDVQRLRNRANELSMSQSDASAIENEIMGATKEIILRRQEEYRKLLSLLRYMVQTKVKEREKRLERLFTEARRLYSARKWQAVVDVFSQIHEEDPAYPDPERMLRSARKALERAQKKEYTLGQYREHVKSAWADGELDRSEVVGLRDLADELEVSPMDTAKIERKIMGDTKDAILERQVRAAGENGRLDELYARARRSHQVKDWQEVVDLFAQINAEDPAYPDPEGLLESAREAEARAQKVAATYREGQQHTNAEQWPQALRSFEQVQALQPGYRETEELLSRVQRKFLDRTQGRTISDEAPSIGIDFGTTNSSMAWYNPELERAEIIFDSEGEDKTPSLVYFGEDETLVGTLVNFLIEDASDDNEQRRELNKRIIRGIKEYLIAPPGRTLPDGRYVRPVEVVTEILKKLKLDAENSFFHRGVERAVITYPAEFDVAKQGIIKEAGHSAGLDEVILLQEPVAAALAYDRAGLDVGEHVLVYDLGSGKFGLAVLQRREQSFEIVVGPKGTDHLGGDNIDEALYSYFDGFAQDQLGRPISLAGPRDEKFLRECRRRKENLSLRERVTVSSLLSGGQVFRHELDRETFNDLIKPYVNHTMQLTEEIIDEAMATGHEVDTVVLAGSSSDLPLVKQRLTEILPVRPLTFDKKDKAVVLGAAHYTKLIFARPRR